MSSRYTIQQLAERSGLSAYTLRYYEKAGLLSVIERSELGHRIYSEDDLAWVLLLIQLKLSGMSIARMKHFTGMRDNGDATLDDRLDLLRRHRDLVAEKIRGLQESLGQIDRHISRYEAMSGGNGAEGMEAYYALRAAHYESIYRRDDPIRQAELAALSRDMQKALAGKRVLEVAAGTGYWTEKAAETAAWITATDAATETLEIARSKKMPVEKIELQLADAYRLDEVNGAFDAVLANFWLSHVPVERMSEFLSGVHRRTGTGAVVFMADNIYVPGIGGELVQRPGDPNTYKLRELPDGTRHELIKNYYDESQLRALLSPHADELFVVMGSCFWWVWFTVSEKYGQ